MLPVIAGAIAVGVLVALAVVFYNAGYFGRKRQEKGDVKPAKWPSTPPKD
jgi:cell division septation protein DedD